MGWLTLNHIIERGVVEVAQDAEEEVVVDDAVHARHGALPQDEIQQVGDVM